MSDQSYNYCKRALATDVGRKRAANEDFLGEHVTVNGLVTVVCDGMGGHVGGAEASHTAVNAILSFLAGQYFDDPCVAIVEAVNYANNAILERQHADPSLAGMGSTCVIIIVRDGKVYYGWVGDSRIYLIRRNGITQLSKDQSVVQGLVDAGLITRAEAEHHARKNEITNCLGIPTMTPAQVCAHPVTPQPGDIFLLCSDGLSGMVSDAGIAEIVAGHSSVPLQHRAGMLIEAANRNGGVDNITALLIEFDPFDNQPRPAQDALRMSASSDSYDRSAPARPRRMPWGMLGALIGAVILMTAVSTWWWVSRDSGKKDAGSAGVSSTVEESTTAGGEVKAVEAKIINFDIYNAREDTPVVVFSPDDKKTLWTVTLNDGTALCSLSGSLDERMIAVSDDRFELRRTGGGNKHAFALYLCKSIDLPLATPVTLSFGDSTDGKDNVALVINIRLKGMPQAED